MSVTSCIPDEILPAFLEGELSDEDSAPWEEHLRGCSRCLERTRSLESANTVAQAGRLVGSVERDVLSPSAFDALIRRLSDPERLVAAAQFFEGSAVDAPTGRSASEVPTVNPLPRPISLESSADLPTDSLLGPYRILSKLGAGGMGTVYKARHQHLDKIVAVKVLPARLTREPEAVARFKREMKAVGRITHPNIVQAFDAGEIDGTHFLAMEYVDGTDLNQLVKTNGPMTVPNACKAIRRAALALSTAHAAGLVHRDVKPSNLLVAKTGQVKLLDLGLALLANDACQTMEVTTAGQAFGTPDYMAPEQWVDAHTAEARTDLYALGCTLFFLLTGRAPYDDENHKHPLNKMSGHCTEAIPDLKSARPDAPDGVVATYQTLMAKKPADRYSSAAELADALAPFALSKSVTTQTLTSPLPNPGTAAGKGISWTAQRLAAAAAGAAAIFLLGVVIVTITNKDGTKTTLKFPEGTEAEIDSPPGSRISITRAASSPKPQTAEVVSSGGWHGWPGDAPKPAIAPFDAAQATKHQEEWAAYLKVSVEYTNSIGMKFRLIPPGEFLMGSKLPDINDSLATLGTLGLEMRWRECILSQAPEHTVILTKPIYVAATEVTQDQYQRVTGHNPSQFAASGAQKERVAGMNTSNFPVDNISWNLAVEFCLKLFQQEKADGSARVALSSTAENPYRLLTEAEWEFACRAGTMTRFWNGDHDDRLSQIAWIATNSGGMTHAVATLPANPFGLFDMSGNVWEKVLDGWDPGYYRLFTDKPAIDPLCPFTTSAERIDRGGYWGDIPTFCQACVRINGSAHSSGRIGDTGFRVALSVDAVRQAQKP